MRRIGILVGATMFLLAAAGAAQWLMSGVHQRAREEIWDAVLVSYGSGRLRSEADMTLASNRLTGDGEQRQHASLVLMVAPDAVPEPRTAWVDSVVRSGMVRSVCRAAEALSCPDSTMTSYLRLGEPVIDWRSATIDVYDAALNPLACRHATRPILTGDNTVTLALERRHGVWRVVKVIDGFATSSVCGAGQH